jgi:hypothetical protein
MVYPRLVEPAGTKKARPLAKAIALIFFATMQSVIVSSLVAGLG